MEVTKELLELAKEASGPALLATTRIWFDHYLRTKKQPTKGKEYQALVAQVLSSVDESRFGSQVQEAAVWAAGLQVQGMPKPLDTVDVTIPIDMAELARRFRKPGRPQEAISEDELHRSMESMMLLGDPGSGKTTALKRLVLAMFTIVPTPQDADLAYPVLVVCREINWSKLDLAQVLGERIGVPIDALIRDHSLSASDALQLTGQLLDSMKCVVVIDGLDEVPSGGRSSLLNDIQRLERLLECSKIVCSTRSGNAPHVDGFSTYELLPLTRQQQMEVVALRVEEKDYFFDAVVESGIDDELMDRPLFLNHLVWVFQATGAVADRPSELYSELVRLMIHEWDEQRRVARRTGIARLDATTIETIISELAFVMTRAQRQVFSVRDLSDTIESVAMRFELKTTDTRKVLREIEGHSGFIIESAAGFQFSHYTLQEHMAARNIVKRPGSKSIDRILLQNPEVAAVAVALSSHPTDWFLDRIKPTLFDTSAQIAVFVNRLGQEKPRFDETTELGEALVRLMSKSNQSDSTAWGRLSTMGVARKAVKRALRRFYLTQDFGRVDLHNPSTYGRSSARRAPRFSIPASLLCQYVDLRDVIQGCDPVPG